MRRLRKYIKIIGQTPIFRANPAILPLLLLLLVNGCKKDKDPVFDPGTDQYINDWVLDSMKVYYYWNNTLPNKPNYNLNPLQFFASIKNSNDRFSQLLNEDVPESYPKTLYSSFGIDLVTLETNNTAQTLLRLVVPGSDGSQAGLKRGERVLTIDGTAVNASNMSSLTETSLKNSSITLEVEGYETPFIINGYLRPNPVYTTKIWDKGGKKIGYIFLNNFETRALPRLKEVFSDFQSQGVNELILDMRYNTGGEVSVAAALAAMITQASEQDIFLEYRGNNNAGTRRHTFGDEITKVFLPLNYSQYTGLRLNINRIFLLTGTHTASAAELLINNLPPYIQTIRIGEHTLGKDMAEFELADHRNPKLAGNWVLWPLVFKVYNSTGKGDYSTGLQPDIEADELSILPLKAFDDPEETLNSLAISRITGAARSARIAAIPAYNKKTFDSRNKGDLQTAPIRVTK